MSSSTAKHARVAQLPASRPVAPLTVAPGNAVQATGLPWRWLRDFARGAGVPIWRVGGKTAIPATQLMAALERAAAEQAPARELTDNERVAALAHELGLELVASAASGSTQ